MSSSEQPVRLVTAVIPEDTAERVRLSHADAILQLQAAGGLILEDVSLASNTVTTVAHKLGRKPFVFISPPRLAVTSGRIVEVRDSTVDRTKHIKLSAQGWGATILVDIWVL